MLLLLLLRVVRRWPICIGSTFWRSKQLPIFPRMSGAASPTLLPSATSIETHWLYVAFWVASSTFVAEPPCVPFVMMREFGITYPTLASWVYDFSAFALV